MKGAAPIKATLRVDGGSFRVSLDQSLIGDGGILLRELCCPGKSLPQMTSISETKDQAAVDGK